MGNNRRLERREDKPLPDKSQAQMQGVGDVAALPEDFTDPLNLRLIFAIQKDGLFFGKFQQLSSKRT
jgi:hypothetical protein